MQSPILTTKLFTPTPPAQIIPRARLFETLQEGTSTKLTLVTAPAGFGKTTLISDWAVQQTKPMAWYSLDERDNDPIRFFTYICTALQQINSQVGQDSLRFLSSSELTSFNISLTYLINDLVQIEQPIVLVIDDYHLIQSQEIHQAITFLLDNLPLKHQLIIISRSEPPLPISRLRGKQILSEITALDLRLNQSEIEFFFNNLLQLNLSPGSIQKIDMQTEGWITGLHLAALSIKDEVDATNLIQKISGSDKFIADYLIDEVLSHQPEHVQQFLLKTSILERLTADLCNTVAGIKNGQELLTQLEKANLFIVSLDNNRKWYRYHHLFQELLQSRLGSATRDTLTQRASRWHKEHGLLEDAITYALLGGHNDQAADIIEESGNNIYWLTRKHIVQTWLEAFPKSFLRNRPHLWILYGYGQIDLGKLRALEITTQEIQEHLEQHPVASSEEQTILEGKLAALKTAVLQHRSLDPEAGLQAAEKALSSLPESYHFYRSTAYFHGGAFLIALGDLERAKAFLDKALTLSYRLNNPGARNLTLGNMGLLDFVSGNLKIAEQYYQELLLAAHPTATRYGSIYANAFTGLANINHEWNKLEIASKHIQEAIQIAEHEEFLDRLIYAYQASLNLAFAQKNHKQANTFLKKARQLITQYNAPPQIISQIEALTAKASLHFENLPHAISWANNFTIEIKNHIRFFKEDELLLLARIQIAQQQHSAAINLLSQLLNLAQRQSRNRSIIIIEILLAKAYSLTCEKTLASTHLQHALQLAEPEKFIRSFLDEGNPIQMLLTQELEECQRSQQDNYSTTYLQLLLESFEQDRNQQTQSQKTSKTDAILTPRELDVLQELARGQTYTEIASTLTISKNTLSHHIKNIYRKLNVNNRVQAILKAQELNLLEK